MHQWLLKVLFVWIQEVFQFSVFVVFRMAFLFPEAPNKLTLAD